MMMVMRGLLGGLFMGGEHGGDGFHALHTQHHRFANLAQGFGLGTPFRRHFQHKADMAVLDHQTGDHVLLNHGAPAHGSTTWSSAFKTWRRVLARRGRGYIPGLANPPRRSLKALDQVVDPVGGRTVVQQDMITGLVVKDGHVGFVLEVAPERGPQSEPLRKICEAMVLGVKGVKSVTAVLTAHEEAPKQAPHDHHHAPNRR